MTLTHVPVALTTPEYLLALGPVALALLLLGWLGRLSPLLLLWRFAVAALLVLALAGPLWGSRAGGGTVVFLVDRSASVERDQAAIDRFVREALGQAGASQAALITFGGNAEVAAPVEAASAVREALGHAPAVVREATDLAQALALARSLPVPGARRVVLLSDGSANGPDPLAEAAAYAARGIPIDVVPQRDAARDDLRVESVAAPGNVWAGDPVDLLAVVRSPAAGDATVRVLLDGREQRAQPLQAAEGDNSLSFELTDLAGGFHQIEVVVESATIPDPVAENDRYPVAVVVRDHPSALLVSDQPAEAQPLTAAWEEHGVRVQSLKPPDLPSRLSDLAPYDAIVLSDVSATEFSLDQLKAIQEHARSLGRGVIVLGGPHAYGAGSYANSELEAALPVKSRLETVPVRRKVSILLIVDRSASMSYDPLGGAPKMEMAKQAAIVAAKALQPGDEIAVLAFNDGLQWIAHRTTLNTPADTQAVVDQIGRIEPEGGTEIYPALEEGFGEIQGSGADVKHVILFTDGKSSGDWAQRYDGLVEQMRRANVTLSTIAIGNDADTELLQRLAQLGGGRYHFTERAQDIPRVTLEETQRVGDRPMLEGVFQPVQALASPIMRGLRPEDLPDVRAYAATDGKPEAQVVLTSDRGDPLLAVWQYGLGRVVAWTTDAGGSGTPDWTAWSGFDQFWFNVLRWALPDPDNRPFSVAAERAADGVTLTLRQTAEQGYVGLGSVSGTIGAGETRVPVAFEQAGPGEYRAHLRAAPTGAYRLDLSIATRDGQRDETFGLAVPCPAEYRPAGDGAALLASLSRITGGKVLDRPDQAFRPLAGSGSAVHYRPVWYVPVALALAAFVAEVARRLGVGLPRRRPAAR